MPPEGKKKRWSAVRPHPDGTVDDVAISCDLFRLEQMDDDAWWACASRGNGKQTDFWLHWDKKSRRIICTVTSDTIGCVNDMSEVPP